MGRPRACCPLRGVQRGTPDGSQRLIIRRGILPKHTPGIPTARIETAPQHGRRRGTHALRCTPAQGTEGYTRPTMHPSTGDGGVHTPYNAHQHGGRRRTHALQCTQHRARRGTLPLGDHWTVLSGGRIPEGNDAGETCRGHTYRRCWRFRNPSPVPDVRTSPLHG